VLRKGSHFPSHISLSLCISTVYLLYHSKYRRTLIDDLQDDDDDDDDDNDVSGDDDNEEGNNSEDAGKCRVRKLLSKYFPHSLMVT
jgi:hypothetical protein